jgi:hypothetical protein
MTRGKHLKSEFPFTRTGSLIECSVPEGKEDADESEEDLSRQNSKKDKTSGTSASKSNKQTKITISDIQHHHNPHHHAHHNHHNYHQQNPINGDQPHTNTQNSYTHLQRLKIINQLCCVDTSSAFNFSLNAKSLLYNLNNGLMKTKQKTSKTRSDADSLSLSVYFKYLYKQNIFTTIWIVFVNLSFSLGALGSLIPIVNFANFLRAKSVQDVYETYIFSLIGACTVIGR